MVFQQPELENNVQQIHISSHCLPLVLNQLAMQFPGIGNFINNLIQPPGDSA